MLSRVALIFLVLLGSCKPIETAYLKFSGSTMGTTYTIIAQSADGDKLKKEVDELLIELNNAVSTYEKESLISLFNNNFSDYKKGAKKDVILNQYLIDNYLLSKKLYKETNGAFDPTVMPLVNYWGFGYEGRNRINSVDSSAIKKILKNVGFGLIKLNGEQLEKSNPEIELDFSGIAKGYGVDAVASFLKTKNIGNFYVEIGGEVYAEGVNANGIIWRTGIIVPSPDSGKGEYEEILEIEDKGIATSGNYRNFYQAEDGSIYSHTINPRTGFPERSNLLSVTIIAPNCAIADGYATACMVLGLEKSKQLLIETKNVEGILIFSDKAGNFKTFHSSKNKK